MYTEFLSLGVLLRFYLGSEGNTDWGPYIPDSCQSLIIALLHLQREVDLDGALCYHTDIAVTGIRYQFRENWCRHCSRSEHLY